MKNIAVLETSAETFSLDLSGMASQSELFRLEQTPRWCTNHNRTGKVSRHEIRLVYLFNIAVFAPRRMLYQSARWFTNCSKPAVLGQDCLPVLIPSQGQFQTAPSAVFTTPSKVVSQQRWRFVKPRSSCVPFRGTPTLTSLEIVFCNIPRRKEDLKDMPVDAAIPPLLSMERTGVADDFINPLAIASKTAKGEALLRGGTEVMRAPGTRDIVGLVTALEVGCWESVVNVYSESTCKADRMLLGKAESKAKERNI
ncbi:hypothetical protein Hypma_008428 [Hypsizygus marmoreus]|uniref:Uncharacterized protein n=1 Tax=Hypsizygus marmoreus TaxID=39966 RepID=A0A369K058_HYPMA|nr:hypothetical protein Hypma_008428 [Hypsizygus marmoreus]